jgi:hypothetical protein
VAVVCRGTRGPDDRSPEAPVETSADSASCQALRGRSGAGVAVRGRFLRSSGASAGAEASWAAIGSGRTSSRATSARGSGEGTAWKGAAVVRGAEGAGAAAAGRAALRDGAGTGGSGSRERES